jgi:RND family efflux transporter MFP subunit
MKHSRPFLVVVSLLVLVGALGCANAAPAAAPTPPAIPATAASAASEGTVTASVEVEPVRTSDLAFLISGRVRQVAVQAGDRVRAGQTLVLLEAPELEYALVSAQADAGSAQLNAFLQRSSRQYKVWNGHRWIWTHGIQELRLKADARLQQSLGALEVAKAELAQSVLAAPFDGTVVSIEVSPGEMIEPNERVLILGDLGQMQVVTTDLSERDIAEVHLGQAARIALKALPSELAGTVAAIDPMAGRSEDGDVIYQVTIQLDEQPPQLMWGMTGEATIVLDS